MQFLESERRELDRLIPGLDQRLTAIALADLEQPESPGLAAFRETGGPGLLVPAEHGGGGADLLAAVRVQRAVGSRSPSLAVATTMHHFSVASLVESAAVNGGLEWMLLAGIAKQNLLLASGFAEGRTGQHILSPTLTARVEGDKVWLSGSKRPCSLARSMNLLTANVTLPTADGGRQMAVALIPADSPGMEVRPFWTSPILAGAESEEVILTDVEVPADLIVRTAITADGHLDHLQTVGFVWFELLITASYLGIASALVERVLAVPVIDPTLRVALAADLEAAMLTVEAVAGDTDSAGFDDDVLARALICRYHAQDVITAVAGRCVEALGGMAFIGSPDVHYLNSACRALAFHPPSRARMAPALLEYFAGGPLRVP